MIKNLNEEQAAPSSNHTIVQSMSGLPYSAMTLVLRIEITMNLCSELKAGWLRLLQNEKQLFVTARKTNNVLRAKFAVKKQQLETEVRYRKHAECH